jgi:hypothetical protein
MYAIVAKVVKPARHSLKKVDPAISSGLKKWSVDDVYLGERGVSYVTAAGEAKEMTETRGGDVDIKVVKKIAKTAEARAANFFLSKRLLIVGRHHAVHRRR